MVAGDGQGGWNITVAGYGKTNAAPFLPYIDYLFSLNVSEDGEVTFVGGTHDGYPSYEVWAYGAEATNLYHHKEGWIGELAGKSDVRAGQARKP